VTPRPLVCAHRGASAYHPDNSRAAFAAAIQIGADIIETDLRRSRDGRLVLAHDPLGAGTTEGLVELAELVELAAGRVALDVELKEAGYEDEVLAALDPRPAGLIVTSFLPRALAAVRALDPSVATGLILRPGRRHADPLARADGCGARAVVAHASLVGDGLGRRTLAAGRPLWVWTVNDPVRLAALMLDRAVTHVITDVPDVAIALRDAIPTSG
jgi:glycerophosphoryl diester phosphodiesterase